MGYSPQELEDMHRTLVAARPEAVVVATPIDLGRLMQLDCPMVRVRYELRDAGSPNLEEVLKAFVKGI